MWNFRKTAFFVIIYIAAFGLIGTSYTFAQDDGFSEDLFEEPEIIPEYEPPPPSRPIEERAEAGEAREGETRWSVDITCAVIMDYVFNDSPDSFTIKYRWEIKGTANASTAIIKGDADIDAEVEGPLSRFPEGECKLEVTVPSIPFELTFKRTADDKSSLKLVFKQSIKEDWQSKCAYESGAHFDTRGAPENWLNKALERARPPLKDIIAEIGGEETTTRFVINKESINDAPLGTGEIEGTGVITISPGGG